jgi:hypothetical protein
MKLHELLDCFGRETQFLKIARAIPNGNRKALEVVPPEFVPVETDGLNIDPSLGRKLADRHDSQSQADTGYSINGSSQISACCG